MRPLVNGFTCIPVKQIANGILKRESDLARIETRLKNDCRHPYSMPFPFEKSFTEPRLARDSVPWKFFPISFLSYLASNATLKYGTSSSRSAQPSPMQFCAPPALPLTYFVIQESHL